jgi:hypothetical protein
MGFAMPRKDNQNSNDLQEKDGKLAKRIAMHGFPFIEQAKRIAM